MKRIVALVVVLVVIIFGLLLWWTNGMSVSDTNDKTSRRFLILPGVTVREIGTNLKKEGFIKDPVVFFLFVKLNGFDRGIQAGDYQLSPSMSLQELTNALNHGVQDIWVTFPEGMRAEEYAVILSNKIPSYDPSWEALLKAENGYLFPDTYLVPRDATIEQVILQLKDIFYKKIGDLGLSRDSSNLSKIVITASLIEREAKTDQERFVIAGIINNRLSDGIALQIDATLQYINGFDEQKNRWWGSVEATDKKLDSLYNTYLYTGLPPGPIANPGLESLKAAANPADTSYYYYLHDSSGKIHYARTLAEHNENVRKYLQ